MIVDCSTYDMQKKRVIVVANVQRWLRKEMFRPKEATGRVHVIAITIKKMTNIDFGNYFRTSSDACAVIRFEITLTGADLLWLRIRPKAPASSHLLCVISRVLDDTLSKQVKHESCVYERKRGREWSSRQPSRIILNQLTATSVSVSRRCLVACRVCANVTLFFSLLLLCASALGHR